jgi:hypothetical protein
MLEKQSNIPILPFLDRPISKQVNRDKEALA